MVSSFKGYDTLDRLTSETDVWGNTLTYGYDAQGNRTSLRDPDLVETHYAFDELNRLETLTLEYGTPSPQTVTYEYLPNGLKDRVRNPNGTATTYGYDAASRMTSIVHTGPSGVVSSYDYQYGPNGNRTQQIEQNAGRTETTLYDYDLTNRLKTVTYEAGTAAASQVNYAYDLVGNRLTERTVQLEGSILTKDLVYDYDAINRLGTIDDLLGTDDVAYVYDPNGNTLSKTKGGVTTEFKYDLRNQLSEVLQGPSVLGRYGYDYENLRILKIGDDGIRRYTYDQLSTITESNETSTTVSKYDYGLDQLVSLDNSSEGRSFFHLDLLGSTTNLTDGIGETRQSIHYDAWGNERDRVGTSANKFTFTGHEKDDETGLIYAKARFYDPDIGRFLNQDKVLGAVANPPSIHRYSYVHSNPLMLIDPTGNMAQSLGELGKKEKERQATNGTDAQVYNDEGTGPVNRPKTTSVPMTMEEAEKAVEASKQGATASSKELDDALRPKVVTEDRESGNGRLRYAWNVAKAGWVSAGMGVSALFDELEAQAKGALGSDEEPELSKYDEDQRAGVDWVAERTHLESQEVRKTAGQGERGREAANELIETGGYVGEQVTKFYVEGKLVKAGVGLFGVIIVNGQKVRVANYTAQSRHHVYTHGHAANSPIVQKSGGKIASRFRPREGGQKFTDEVLNHPDVKWVAQSNGRIRYWVDDLGRATGRDQYGQLTRGGEVIVEGANPASWSSYVPHEVVTQYPR